MSSIQSQPNLYSLFAPRSLAESAPRWATKLAGSYPLVFGFSRFAHLFVCSSLGNKFAIVVTDQPELIPLNMSTREAFISQFLRSAEARSSFFREADYLLLTCTIGSADEEECFYPVPYPAIGGSGKLDTYRRGNVWVHLDLYAQILEIG